MTDREEFESHIRSLDGTYNLLMVGDVYIDVETQIEWRTWQKAWQAALASQQPADDGWIEWAGGECPVDPASFADIRWEDGSIEIMTEAGRWRWSNWVNGGPNIIAYRVVNP